MSVASPLLAPNDTDGMLRWLNDRVSALEQTAIIPVGLIAWVPGDVPNGWLMCDGSSLSATRYGQLAQYLGSTTLPDIRGRVVAGQAASGTFVTLRGTGGVETVTLTASQSGMPTHTTGDDSPDHAHVQPPAGSFGITIFGAQVAAGASFAAVNNFATATGGATARHQHSVSGQSAASSHSNLQPYIVLVPIIKF